MIDIRKLIMLLAIGACFSLQSYAADQDQTLSNDQVQSHVLELETAGVEVLELATVESEAAINADEVHQESTVGRSGLQGACVGPFDDE